jgi:hypothetical protein
MQNAAASLRELHRLVTDDGFALSMLAVVGFVTILAFGFGATPEVAAPLLILGIATALAERKLHAKK